MSSPEERNQDNNDVADLAAREGLAQDATACSASAGADGAPVPGALGERSRVAGRFEPTVGEHLRLGQFVAAIEKASPDQLRDLCKRLAQQALLVYPAMLRGLAWEAAENLAAKPWGEERSEELVAELVSKVKGASRLPEDG